jgi:uncharacterized membrane protein (UPF0182 family)
MTATPHHIPRPSILWRSFAFWTWLFFAVVAALAVPDILVQFWFNQSLGFRGIFLTNLWMQACLLVASVAIMTMAAAVPALGPASSPPFRRGVLQVGVWAGLVAGWWLSGRYQAFLLALYGVPFGQSDPVFGRDIGFYVYTLPAVRPVIAVLEAALLLGLGSACLVRHRQLSSDLASSRSRWTMGRVIGAFSTPHAEIAVGMLGILLSVQTFLSRYDLLQQASDVTGVRTGAGYVDVVGVVSTLNARSLAAAVVLGLTLVTVLAMRHLRAHHGDAIAVPPSRDADALLAARASRRTGRRLAWAAGTLAVLQVVAWSAVTIRNYVFVRPNEPVVQLPFIERHIQATRAAYGLDRVEVHEWNPPAEPVSVEGLLSSRTVQRAPVLPSWVSWLEEPPDRHHFERIKTTGSTLVFGPLLQTYQQSQQLRPYYDFLSVDGVRYTIDGEKRMFASAVRELPSLALVGPKEWLKYWGSAALLFTHGMGLVMSPVDEVDPTGAPTYAVDNVPPRVSHRALAHEPRIYFGEGAKDDYVLTNVNALREFDFATDQFREEFAFPEDLADGIRVDSLLKRAAFAIHTGDLTAFLFSRYIDPARTRVHLRRTPITRIQSVAPFLFLDSNAFAFIAGGRVHWMVNALTTTDQYPYSFREVLGDKADERAVEDVPQRTINYAEDAVKITIDAYGGEMRLYRMTDDPIIRSWDRIYPGLLRPRSEMPPDVSAQLTYPLQWFHTQFDDIYKRYHQTHPVEFYNVEDLWDDADETLGSLGRGLTAFGTGDQMTFSYEGYNALLDPADMPAGVNLGRPGDLQYSMLMPFTPEAARNLRALIVAVQDPGQYGRLLSLQIPQGRFVPGPEQVDAYIDNDRPIHQQVTMWIRHASEVLRGSTLLLPVKGDVMYVETVWVNSLQNELPQLKLTALYYRDRITSGASLNDAIRKRTLGAESPEERQDRERDDERRRRREEANAYEVARGDVHAEPSAGLQPQQSGQRAGR